MSIPDSDQLDPDGARRIPSSVRQTLDEIEERLLFLVCPSAGSGTSRPTSDALAVAVRAGGSRRVVAATAAALVVPRAFLIGTFVIWNKCRMCPRPGSRCGRRNVGLMGTVGSCA